MVGFLDPCRSVIRGKGNGATGEGPGSAQNIRGLLVLKAEPITALTQAHHGPIVARVLDTAVWHHPSPSPFVIELPQDDRLAVLP